MVTNLVETLPDGERTENHGEREPSVDVPRAGHAACSAGGVCHCREAELQEQAQQYRSIFEATSDALIISDLAGFAVEVNPAACEMYGYSYDELIGLHRTAFVHRTSHHLINATIEAATSGDTIRFEAVDVRKDGTPFHVEGRGTRFTFRGAPYVLAVARDISDRVEAERRYRRNDNACLASAVRNLARCGDHTWPHQS